MDFFKKIFSKDKSPEPKPESTPDPVPAQDIPGIEPIVAQAVENLFSDESTRNDYFEFLLEISRRRKGIADSKTLLALLYYSNGDLEKFKKSAWQSHPHFLMDEISPIFRTMEEAEEWVRSISVNKD